MIRFILNEKEITTGLPPGMVVLDLIRYHQHLTGTKIGCREGDCGACTVLVGELVNGALQYQSMTSCLLALGNVQGKHIITVEGVNMEGLNPVQQAMADEGATQCGFCTPGFVVSLAGFCLSEKEPTPANAIAAVDGNICRCTGYKSIERAAIKISNLLADRKDKPALAFAVENKLLPGYLSSIKNRLTKLLSEIHQPQTTDHRQPVAGGTDLYVQKHDELAHAEINFLFDRSDLKGITQKEGLCRIGAAATVSHLKNSAIINDAFPGFRRYAKLVSSTPIRNMATVAGNLVNASPIGDLTIFFLALDAQVELHSAEEKRVIPLREFYRGYKQLDKKPGEMITSVSFTLPGPAHHFHFEKVSKRTHLDIASVNSAILLKINGDIIETAGLSAGGVGPVPMYLKKTSEWLAGKAISDETIRGAIDMMKTEIAPISDARGSKEYKTLLLGQLIKAHFNNFRELHK